MYDNILESRIDRENGNNYCRTECKQHTKIMKKRSERCKHCALAVVMRSQKCSPRRRPLPGGAGRPKFNQLETVTTFTHKSSLVRIDARNFELSYHSNRPTHTPTHPQTGQITIHCAAASAQCNKSNASHNLHTQHYYAPPLIGGCIKQ